MNLSEKAMLVKLNISKWSARKHDRNISNEIADKYFADHDMGRYHKILLPKESLREIKLCVSRARDFHYNNTLPWDDTGARILPVKNFDYYREHMTKHRNDFEQSVDDFCREYDTLISEANKRLNGLFDANDYPHKTEIVSKFRFNIAIDPLPEADDFRVSLNREEITEIKKDYESRTKETLNQAMQSLWQRLYENVNHMVDRLKNTDNVFRDSLINNLLNLCQLLPRLNVNDDPQLEKMRKRIEKKLCGTTPQELRDNLDARNTVVKEAKGILKAMEGYIGG